MLFITSFAFAKDEWRLTIGESISIHPMASSNRTADQFSNKLSSDGTLVKNSPTIELNKMTIRNHEYNKFTMFYSRDCVDSPVYGYAYSYGHHSPILQYGFAFGGYFMNEKPWNDRGITKSWFSIGNKQAIVPIIGGEVNVRIIKLGPTEVNWHTYINPFLTNTTLSIGFSF